MEMMPYQPGLAIMEPDQASSTLGSMVPTLPTLPTFGAVAAGDWRDGLPVLSGQSCTLRELTFDDAPSLFAHVTTEQVARFISPPPTSVAGFEDFIRWAHRRRSQGRYACFGIVPAGETQAVGMFQIHVDDIDPEMAQWGFVLGAAYWGTEIFISGARRVVDFAFAQMGLRRLEARSVLQNGRGNGALRKVGAVREAVLPQSFERHGKRLDQALWTIMRDAWRGTLADLGPTIH